MMSNAERAERAAESVDAWLAYANDDATDFSSEELLNDILVDLQHWAAGEGMTRRDVQMIFTKSIESCQEEIDDEIITN